jgi:putative hydrolase of the HAD superfamily
LSFDGDATLWDFEKVMRQALGAVLWELQCHLSQERLQNLDVDRMIHIRDTVARELKGKEFNLERIRFFAFRQTLAYIGMEDDALAHQMNKTYLKNRFANIELYADVLPTFDILKRDFVLGLLSNGNTYPERCGLAGYFGFVVLAQDYGVEKPHRRLFEVALQEAGCTAGEMLHIGDSLENDVAGAQDAGIRAVWLNRLGEANVTNIRPDWEITTLRALASLSQWTI